MAADDGPVSMCPNILGAAERFGAPEDAVRALALELLAADEPDPRSVCRHAVAQPLTRDGAARPRRLVHCPWTHRATSRVTMQIANEDRLADVNWVDVAAALSAGFPWDEALGRAQSGTDMPVLRLMYALQPPRTVQP